MSEFTSETLPSAKSALPKSPSQASSTSTPSPRSRFLSSTTPSSLHTQPHLIPSYRLNTLDGVSSIEDYASIPRDIIGIGDAAPKQDHTPATPYRGIAASTSTTNNIGSVASPTPTPSSTQQFSAHPTAFVPRPASKVALKDARAKDVDIGSLVKKRPPADGTGQQHNRGSNHAQGAQFANLKSTAHLQHRAQYRFSLALVYCKVTALLNKLALENFDSISNQIIAWANKSEQETDGRTLITVIRLIFEKATRIDEARWLELYAHLCRKMMERISPKVEDQDIKNAEGKPIAGAQLFRKYLLNRCQEDFERGLVDKEPTSATTAKVAENDAASGNAVQKAKRRGPGLARFFGELFKLQMLTERVMHECVKVLLRNVENPEEEEIESLWKLLTTAGAILDTPRARAHMDIYFSRMKELTKSQNVRPRMQFMLQDLLELRERKWVPRNAAAAPTTLSRIHENAARAKAQNEAFQRQASMFRTSWNRGRGNEFEQTNPDGWAVGGGPARPAPKAGDLSNFGKISKTREMPFGPTSVFSKNKNADKRESLSRSASSSNMFSMVSARADAVPEPKAKPPQQRRKLVLQPRTIPKEHDAPSTNPPFPAGSDNGSDEEESAAAPDMSDEEAKKKIKEDIKELFAVRNLDEAEVYFIALPPKHHSTLVDKIVTKAVESKATDAVLVASFFERACSKELCSSSSFESGFELIAKFIYDIALDAPMAPQLFAKMVKAAGLSEQARQQIASKSPDSDQLFALLS